MVLNLSRPTPSFRGIYSSPWNQSAQNTQAKWRFKEALGALGYICKGILQCCWDKPLSSGHLVGSSAIQRSRYVPGELREGLTDRTRNQFFCYPIWSKDIPSLRENATFWLTFHLSPPDTIVLLLEDNPCPLRWGWCTPCCWLRCRWTAQNNDNTFGCLVCVLFELKSSENAHYFVGVKRENVISLSTLLGPWF